MPTVPRPVVCPSCGEKTGVKLIFGMPGPDLIEAAERGDVALGGCLLTDPLPDRHCRSCGAEWTRKPAATRWGDPPA